MLNNPHLVVFGISSLGSLVHAILHIAGATSQRRRKVWYKDGGTLVGIIIEAVVSGIISVFYFWKSNDDGDPWRQFVFGAAAASLFNNAVMTAEKEHDKRKQKKAAHLGDQSYDASMSFGEKMRMSLADYFRP